MDFNLTVFVGEWLKESYSLADSWCYRMAVRTSNEGCG